MPKYLVLFDGECNLCHGAVRFLYKHNTSKDLYFGSLQAIKNQELITDLKHTPVNMSSLVFLSKGKCLTKSQAIFALIKHLNWPWKPFLVFSILPTFINDALYSLIAKNRFRIFGKRNQCDLPASISLSRFHN